jgi:hypothetical protein
MATVAPSVEYKEFRRKYAKLLKSARSVMDTPLQRNVVEAVAGTAFQAGFNMARTAAPLKKVKPKKWKTTKPD